MPCSNFPLSPSSDTTATKNTTITAHAQYPHAVIPQRTKTKFGNDFPPSAIYHYVAYYRLLYENRLVLVLQHNNLTIAEQHELRKELDKKQASLTVIRRGIFLAMLRRTVEYANLRPLIVGPTALITSNVSDEENPKLVSDLLSAIDKHKKFLLVGGKFENSLLDPMGIDEVGKLPSLVTLRGQLLGFLASIGQGVVGVLGQNAQSMVFTLQMHKESLEKKAGTNDGQNEE